VALSFLVAALEVKRQLLVGRAPRRCLAAPPVVGAVGMVVPVVLFLAVNRSGPEVAGWGIPMATDIAFGVGVLALVARSVPLAARLFLFTVAIVDDIGAIAVVAVVHRTTIEPRWLASAAVVVGVLVLGRRAHSVPTPVSVVLGTLPWLVVLASGIHATVAGVVLGLVVPAAPELTRELVRSRTDELLDVFTPRAAKETTRIARQSVSQLEWLEHQRHGWAGLVVVPVFALANAGVPLAGVAGEAWCSPVTLGVVLASWWASRSGSSVPPGSRCGVESPTCRATSAGATCSVSPSSAALASRSRSS